MPPPLLQPRCRYGAILMWRWARSSASPAWSRFTSAASSLTLVDHPYLVIAYESSLRAGDFFGLEAALSPLTSDEASAATVSLLITFHDLLTHLIGGSLFERLLCSVWDKPSSGNAAKDNAS